MGLIIIHGLESRGVLRVGNFRGSGKLHAQAGTHCTCSCTSELRGTAFLSGCSPASRLRGGGGLRIEVHGLEDL